MYAFDIETEHWDTFVVGGILSDTGEWLCHDWRSERELAEYMLCGIEGEVWGHNAGRYDTLWAIDWIRRLRLTARVFATSARITLVKVGNIEIRDSAALCPMSLEKAAQIGGYKKANTGLKCIETTECEWFERKGTPCKGGYCAISRNMPSEDLERLKIYLRQDCECVLNGVIKPLREYAEKNNLTLAGTIGASSWRTAKSNFGLPDAKWTPARLYSKVRQSYYGGRVQVFRPWSLRGKRWDINSAYISALTRTYLPLGTYREAFRDLSEQSYSEGKEGTFTVKVMVPESHIPPLPYRDDKQRVWFPHGIFWGHWTGLELRYAETLGVKILEFESSVIWDESEPILAPFAQRVWELRHVAGKETSLGQWLKWFGNSFTGKCAQKPETDICSILTEPPEGCTGDYPCGGVLCGVSDKCCKHSCTGRCGIPRPLGRHSGIWVKESWRLSPNAHVQWAAYLTAQARIMLHKEMISDGLGGITMAYCDTDSNITERQSTPNEGDDLGQFMYEGSYTEFRALAPKTYSFIAGTDSKKEKDRGQRIVRAKGIPEPDWIGILKGEPQRVRSGIKQFRSAARDLKDDDERIFRRRDMFRTVALDRFGDRILEPGSETTRACSFNEIKNSTR